MKPVLILQHLSADGPAYLQTWLQQRGVPMVCCDSQAGQAFPASLQPYSALAILGGEMSANSEMPELRQAEVLVLQAVQHGVPTLGHCLGGQLMARALGARVQDSPAPEIGWQALQVHASPAAQSWLGDAGERFVYHWHYESFDLPTGAEWLASSRACPHQAFALGPHLAMQFHVELDAEKLSRWAAELDQRYAQVLGQSNVQTGSEMLADADRRLPAQQRLADHIYSRWLQALG
jgi:GMP synthase-like glutamine amidotransferase